MSSSDMKLPPSPSPPPPPPPPSSYSFPSSSISSPSVSSSKPTFPASSPLGAFLRWARLKKYRIEVTYGVYVYTPVEKALFWAIFCVLFVAISAAALLCAGRNLAVLAHAARDRYYDYYVVSGGSGGGGASHRLLSALMASGHARAAAPAATSTAELGAGVVAANSQGA